MSLIIAHQTHFLELVRKHLAQHTSSEAGIPVNLSPRFPIVISSFIDSFEQFLNNQDVGVLVISARPHLLRGESLRSALDLKQLLASNIALLGVHKFTPEERIVLDRGIQSYSMQEISVEGLGEVTDAVMSYVRGWKHFVILLDIDVLDPMFIPGLKNPVPGGFSTRELLYILQRLKLIRSFAGAMVVCNIETDSSLSADVVASVIAELLVER